MIKPPDIEAIADGWIKEALANKKCSEVDGRDLKYFLEISDLIGRDPPTAWAILKSISEDYRVDKIDDDFGMGILSSFVFHHGVEFRYEIRDFWKLSYRFRQHYKMVIFCDLAEAAIFPEIIMEN